MPDLLVPLFRKLGQIRWDESEVVEQLKVIQFFIKERDKLSLIDCGRAETEFQRRLRMSRDEWYRLLISRDTEKLRLLKEHWEKLKLQSQKPGAYKEKQQPAEKSIYPQGGWLGEFVFGYGRIMESPDSFLFWSGVAALSAVIRRHVYVNFGPKNLYPNMYVILVAPAGMARKGAPIKAAEEFVKIIPDVNFIDRTTTERLPHDLSYRVQVVGGQTTKVPCDAQAFLCAEELVAILDDQSYNAGVMKFLIDWWDCPDRRATRSISHNVIELLNLHLTLLGGTTPGWLQGALSSLIAGGGMLSRAIWVVENRTKKRLSWPGLPDENIARSLREQIVYIEAVKGEFSIDKSSFDWNDDWYNKFRDHLEANESDAPALERRQIHQIKLAMILALSEGKDLVITPELLQVSSDILDKQEEGAPELARILTANPKGRESLMILGHMQHNGGFIYHSDLLRRLSPYGINKDELKQMIDTLEESGEIEVDMDTTKGRPAKIYRLKKGKKP